MGDDAAVEVGVNLLRAWRWAQLAHILALFDGEHNEICSHSTILTSVFFR